jgi:hypothetical protein
MTGPAARWRGVGARVRMFCKKGKDFLAGMEADM